MLRLKGCSSLTFFPIMLLRGMSPAHSMEQQCMVITEARWDVGKDKKKERGTKSLEALVGPLNLIIKS